MELPMDILSGNYKKPRFFLCETDKEKICQLETIDTQGSFKFNSLSELSFEVPRIYNNIVTGETKVNPHYSKIEALRLICIEGFGYFELQGPELIGDGIKESKVCKAYSLEYTLSTKFLEDFYVNTGEHGSIEVTYAEDVLHDINKIEPVTLYNTENPQLSLLHLVLEKAYGWSIGHVDSSLATLSRQFEVDRESIYDFLMNEVCEKFNCYIVFDTINNKINVYAESLTAKFIGDGKTKEFIVSPPFININTVSIDGYKTTKWEYNDATGVLTLEDAPASESRIEVVDGALTGWETDVFISFDNLAQEINVSYDSDNIKTVLTVSYGDDGDIRDINLGLPYITDLSYYYTREWMGNELYDAYTKYLQKNTAAQSEYSKNAQQILKLQNKISSIKNRLSIVYGMDSSVNPKTVGMYYVIDGGIYPDYTYREVSLPDDYDADVVYYKLNGVNITEDKIHTLFSAIRKYFVATHQQEEPEIKDIATKEGTYTEIFDELTEIKAFDFVSSEFNTLKSALNETASVSFATSAVRKFLGIIWNELGLTPLEKLFLDPYKEVQSINVDSGYAQADHKYYWFYYPVTIMIDSLNEAINKRKQELAPFELSLSECYDKNAKITDDLLMSNNFTEKQMFKLSAFLREDELTLDNIVETDLDDADGKLKVKQDALESGRIELQKLCQPQLHFSMTMANIYALPEFYPIVHQFQLGRVIRVALRPDYIKQSRLLQIDINFDDFSDFSCEFGDLTEIRSQTDIHADLLSKAISAGKSVATNSSYWTKGSDKATSIDLKIQQGLLDAVTAIKSIDGTQNVIIDKYGIHLQKADPTTGEIDDKQGWIVNNQFLYSDDGFKTTKSVFGEYTVDNKTYWGLLAEAVIAGYIEGSKIKGGTIQIGDLGNGNWSFEVDEDGNVSMLGGSVQFNSNKNSLAEAQTNLQGQIDKTNEQVQTINSSKMYRIEVVCEGPQIFKIKNQTAKLKCRVYSWDTDITDSLDKSLFNWKRHSDNSAHDSIWNNATIHRGAKELIISTEDIMENANFSCEVILPDSE